MSSKNIRQHTAPSPALCLLHVHEKDSAGFRSLSFNFKRTLTRNAIVSFHFDATRGAHDEHAPGITDTHLLTHYKRLASRRRTICPTIEKLLKELQYLGLSDERIDMLRRNLKTFASQTGVKNFDAIAAHISVEDAMYFILRGLVYAGAATELEEEHSPSAVKEHFLGEMESIPFKTEDRLRRATRFLPENVSTFKTPGELFVSPLQALHLLPHVMEGVKVGTTKTPQVIDGWPTLARCSDFMTLPARGSVFCGMSMWQYIDLLECGSWRSCTTGKLTPELYPGKVMHFTTSREAALWFAGLYNAISFEDRPDTFDVVVETEIAADTPFRLIKKGRAEDLTFVNLQRLRKRPFWDVPIMVSRFTPIWIELFGENDTESISEIPACSYQLAVIDEVLVGHKYSVCNEFESRVALVHSSAIPWKPQ